MLNTKYIVLVDDTKELCELVAELYENEIDYEIRNVIVVWYLVV